MADRPRQKPCPAPPIFSWNTMALDSRLPAPLAWAGQEFSPGGTQASGPAERTSAFLRGPECPRCAVELVRSHARSLGDFPGDQESGSRRRGFTVEEAWAAPAPARDSSSE